MCLVGSFKFLPPDPQAFQSMMGSHRFSPYNGRCFDWRFVSLTVGMPFLYLTHSTMVRLVRLELTRLSTRASKTRMATNYITDAYSFYLHGYLSGHDSLDIEHVD